MKKPQNTKSTSKRKRAPGATAVSVAEHRSYVFYGRSGTGKTTLSCTFPGPILLLDIKDEGTDSVSDVKDVDVKEIEDTDDIDEMYYWVKENPGAYKTVVIDTVTQWQNMVISEIVGDKGRGGKKAGDWGSMTQKDWGKVAGVLKEKFVDWRDLAKECELNVIFLAQDRVFNLSEDEDDRDNAIDPEVGPALSPAVAKVLNAAVSVIGNTFIRTKVIKREGKKGKIIKTEKEEYCLRIGPNPAYVTKVRKPKSVAAPSFLEDPTYEDIIELIKGE